MRRSLVLLLLLLIARLEQELNTAEQGVVAMTVASTDLSAVTILELGNNVLESRVFNANFEAFEATLNNIIRRMESSTGTEVTVAYPSTPGAFVLRLSLFVVQRVSKSRLALNARMFLHINTATSINCIDANVLVELVASANGPNVVFNRLRLCTSKQCARTIFMDTEMLVTCTSGQLAVLIAKADAIVIRLLTSQCIRSTGRSSSTSVSLLTRPAASVALSFEPKDTSAPENVSSNTPSLAMELPNLPTLTVKLS